MFKTNLHVYGIAHYINHFGHIWLSVIRILFLVGIAKSERKYLDVKTVLVVFFISAI